MYPVGKMYNNSMKQIPLTQGKFAIVDDEDFEKLDKFNWQLQSLGYAVRYKRIGVRKLNKRMIILMHRVINKTPDGFETDHRDRNKLNNQKSNLRTVTRSQNQQNIGILKNNTSGYRGIRWDKVNNKWLARIYVGNKGIHLGRYSTLQGAWLARRWGERLYFGGTVNG